MSSTINSPGPSNSIKSFDVEQVLKTLRTPLEALQTLVEKERLEALSRERIKTISNRPESSQTAAQENPYHNQTLQTILSENSSQPIDQNDFLATVKQIKEACANHISDNYSLFDQLEKLHSTGINFTGKDPYARLKEELRLGLIATGAKQVLGQLAIGEHTEPYGKLVKVLKFIEQEWLKPSSVRVNSSLVKEFELEPDYQGDSFRSRRAAAPSLPKRLGDSELAQLTQHNVKMLLKSAQDWRAENGGQSVNNAPLTKGKFNFRDTIANISKKFH